MDPHRSRQSPFIRPSSEKVSSKWMDGSHLGHCLSSHPPPLPLSIRLASRQNKNGGGDDQNQSYAEKQNVDINQRILDPISKFTQALWQHLVETYPGRITDSNGTAHQPKQGSIDPFPPFWKWSQTTSIKAAMPMPMSMPIPSPGYSNERTRVN